MNLPICEFILLLQRFNKNKQAAMPIASFFSLSVVFWRDNK